jgi:hypothetical protein
MTDGTYTGDDPAPWFRRIASLTSSDGPVLVENIFLDPTFAREMGAIKNVRQWSGINSASTLATPYARMLRDASSRLPRSYLSALRQDGYALEDDAVMMLPGHHAELVSLGFQMSASTPVSRF